jgi:hypothetical protein
VNATRERPFALLPNVRRDATRADDRVTIAKRIAFVETTVLRSPHTTAGFEHHGVECAGQGPFIVEIRAA